MTKQTKAMINKQWRILKIKDAIEAAQDELRYKYFLCDRDDLHDDIGCLRRELSFLQS